MDSSNDELLTELLNSSVTEVIVGTSTAQAVKKAKYHELSAIGNLTSYSMQQVLRRCPREFQISKLSAAVNGDSEELGSSTTFAFGHAVGAGVATYDETGSLKQSIWAAFLAWDIDLFEEEPARPMRPSPKKSFHHAIWALYCYQSFVNDETDLPEYEVVKNEATVVVDFENGHFYIGHIDSLMRNKYTNKLLIKENKTTSFAAVNPAMYANSDQALSYALIIDSFGETEYAVLYTIYSSTEQRWLQFEFTKSALQKAEWLQTQTIQHSTLETYAGLDFFPKNGDACLRFGRTCRYFESCDFDSTRVFGIRYRDLRAIKSAEEIESIETVDYSFKWSDLVKKQQENL